MKKLITVLVLFALVTGGAFAQIQMSAGGGLLLDYSSGNGIEVMSYELKSNSVGFGAYGFFDATYVEASVNFAIGFGSLEIPGVPSEDFTTIRLGFNLLGKYPFNLGSITLFPMAGISYDLVLAAGTDDGDVDNPGDFSQFGLLFGAGMDYDFSEKLFLRASALLQLRFPSKAMNDLNDEFGLGGDLKMGLGPQIRVGIGYRF